MKSTIYLCKCYQLNGNFYNRKIINKFKTVNHDGFDKEPLYQMALFCMTPIFYIKSVIIRYHHDIRSYLNVCKQVIQKKTNKIIQSLAVDHKTG